MSDGDHKAEEVGLHRIEVYGGFLLTIVATAVSSYWSYHGLRSSIETEREKQGLEFKLAIISEISEVAAQASATAAMPAGDVRTNTCQAMRLRTREVRVKWASIGSRADGLDNALGDLAGYLNECNVDKVAELSDRIVDDCKDQMDQLLRE